MTIPTLNILRLSDELGIERGRLHNYFQANLGQQQSTASIQDLLHDVFSDAVTTTAHEEEQGLTRAQLNITLPQTG